MRRRELLTGLGAASVLGAVGSEASAEQNQMPVAGNSFVTVRPREDADSRTEQRFHVRDPLLYHGNIFSHNIYVEGLLFSCP